MIELPQLGQQIKKNIKEVKFDAYRLFFPLGLFFGIIGVLVWFLMLTGNIETYPRDFHADAMTSGFLLMFTVGFLMTAFPWFTGTFGFEFWELSIYLTLSLLTGFLSFYSNRLFFHGALFFNLLFLLALLLRRLRVRSMLPPFPLIFVFLALAAGIIGEVFTFYYLLTGSGESFHNLARAFWYQGFQDMFILGVGIFLIPNLMGHGGCSPPIAHGMSPMKKGASSFFGQVPQSLWVVSLLFLASFLLEDVSSWLGLLIRSIIFTLVSFHDWKIYRFPPHKSALSYGLWLSCWFLLIGHWATLLDPRYSLHLRHMMYIGGWGLMTLMIATRVTLSHGRHDLGLESRSWLLKSAIFLLLLAGVTRMMARYFPEQAYEQHLFYAASVWMVACVLWGILCIPKCFVVRR